MKSTEWMDVEIRLEVYGMLIDRFKKLHPFYKDDRDLFIMEKNGITYMIHSVLNYIEDLEEKGIIPIKKEKGEKK